MPVRGAVPLFVLLTFASFAQQSTLRRDVAPEDPNLRAEAVSLLERATMLSTPVWPANEISATWRVMRPEPGQPATGELKVSVANSALKRFEFFYGAYHFIQVNSGREIAVFRTEPYEPAPVTAVRKLLPVNLVQFESADVIPQIVSTDLEGQPARCVQLETITGDKIKPGELCFDTGRGFLILIRDGDQVTSQSAFFPFNNAFLPGRVERWNGNVKLYEIDQKVVARTDYSRGYFEYPPDAKVTYACQAFHSRVRPRNAAAGAQGALERRHRSSGSRKNRKGRQARRP